MTQLTPEAQRESDRLRHAIWLSQREGRDAAQLIGALNAALGQEDISQPQPPKSAPKRAKPEAVAEEKPAARSKKAKA